MQDLAFHKEQCEINGVQFVTNILCSYAMRPITKENFSMV